MYAATNQRQVPVTPLEWVNSGPRRVSVNNLGFGGTNAHAILEEAPPRGTMLGAIDMPTSHILENGDDQINGYDLSSLSGGDRSANLSRHSDATSCRLFVLSANDAATLKRQMAALSVYLDNQKHEVADDIMADLAFTLSHRRSLLSYRIALASSTAEDLKKQLDSSHQGPTRASRAPNLGFVFTGQGANWQGMGRELFETYPVFTSTIVAADKYLTDLGAPWSLISRCCLGLAVNSKLIDCSRAVTTRAKIFLFRKPAGQPASLYSHTAGISQLARIMRHPASFCDRPFQW